MLLILGWVLLTLASGATMGIPSLISSAAILGAGVLRRFSIRLAAMLAVLGAVLQLLGRAWLTPLGELGYVPVLYALGSSPEARWRRFGLGSALAAVVLGPSRTCTSDARRGGTHVLIIQIVMTASMSALVPLSSWTAGYLRHQQRATIESTVAAQIAEIELARLSAAHEQIALRERIATEMHDVVGHSWTVVAAQDDGARYALANDPARAEQALVVSGETARATITDLRDFLRQLRFEEQPEGQTGPEQRDSLLQRIRASGHDLRVHEEDEPPPSPLLCSRTIGYSPKP